MVELIVVLVILAILAAILVPALLGYIDRAKSSQDIINARNCITATQAEITNQYVYHEPGDKSIIKGINSGSNGDMFVANSDFAHGVLDTADDHPYLLIVGLGKYDKYKSTDLHKAYTVYFAAYMETEDSTPIFFDGTNWGTKYPWSGDGKNDFVINGETITLQFYVLAAPQGQNSSTVWTTLKKKAGVIK